MAVTGQEQLIGIAMISVLNYYTIWRNSRILGDAMFIIIGLLMLIPLPIGNPTGSTYHEVIALSFPITAFIAFMIDVHKARKQRMEKRYNK